MVRQVTGKVNQDDGSDPVYKSQVTFYPEQNGSETLFINQPRLRWKRLGLHPLLSVSIAS